MRDDDNSQREGRDLPGKVVMQACDGILVADERGAIIELNRAMERITGLEAQEVLDQPVWDICFRMLVDEKRTPADYAQLKQNMLQILQTGRSPWSDHLLEREFIHCDGRRITVECLESSIQTDDGYMLVGTCRDVTARKRGAEALQEAYRAIVEHSLQGLVVYQDGRLVLANPATTQITGYTHDELLALSPDQIMAIIHPDDRERGERNVQKWLAGEAVPAGQQYRVYLRDGALRWVEVQPAIITYRGRPALQAVFLDVTAHKLSQDALRRALDEARHAHRLLLALSRAAQAVQRARSPDQVYHIVGEEMVRLGFHALVLTLSDDRAHIAVSYGTYPPEALRQVEALTDSPMLGHRFPLTPGGFYQRIVAEGQALYADQASISIAEALPWLTAQQVGQIVDRLGNRQRVGAPLMAGGEVRGVLVVTGSELTEADVPAVAAFANQAAIAIANAELLAAVDEQRQELRDLSAQLIRSQEAERARIARELHDEIGQALTAMSINLAGIGKDLPPSSSLADGERLSETRELVEQTLAQVSELSLDLRPSMLDHLGLVPTLRWYTDRYARRLHIAVELEATDLPEALSSDVETALYRVVQEALTNVARHARASRVQLHLERRGDTVVAAIADDGCGFDVKRSTDRLAFAHGVGLLGMRERVAALGGHLSVQSRKGQGTRLAVEIPL